MSLHPAATGSAEYEAAKAVERSSGRGRATQHKLEELALGAAAATAASAIISQHLSTSTTVAVPRYSLHPQHDPLPPPSSAVAACYLAGETFCSYCK